MVHAVTCAPMSNNHYDVVIVGGGISGGALLYELATYTNVKRILLLEKYDALATLNSHGTGNSQTIHCGDIETNYTLEKAIKVKKTAKMVEKYCLQHGYQNTIMWSHQKMVMGVGDQEVSLILKRYEEIRGLYPFLEVYDKKKLREIEPAVILDSNGNDRPENVMAVGAQGQYTTVDFGALAQTFVDNAQKSRTTTADVRLNTRVLSLEKKGGRYDIKTNGETYSADFVVVNAGSYSLYLAHRMGYGTEYACLPMAGSFYMANRKLLNGKVYMVQNLKLPFLALHGDPDLLAEGRTRFGPTAVMIPRLERYKSGTFVDFVKTLRFDGNVAATLGGLLSDSEIRRYVLKNFLFEVPIVNKRLFVKDARKIIPSLQLSDITYAKGFGGVRPQIIHKTKKTLMLGEASIDTGEGLIFNMTPSPGATSCLGNGEGDVRRIADRLGLRFDEDRFSHDLT